MSSLGESSDSGSSSSENEPVPSPTESFASYNALLQKSVVASAKLAASLPGKAELSFERTLDKRLANDLDTCSARILDMANQMLSFVDNGNRKGKQKARQLTGEEDVVERYHSLVVDVLDKLFENVDSCLDEYAGKKTLAVPLEKPNKPPKPDTSQRLDQRLLNANIPKPQLKFTQPFNNFANPWRHNLKSKRHAIQPLNHLEPHPYCHEIENIEYPAHMFETPSPAPPGSFEDTPFTWIDNPDGLSELLLKLRQANEIAIDLEHHYYRSFAGFVCLMQISTRHEDFIIDTLALRDELEALNDVFADPNIPKVLHGAEWDIQWLQRDFNLYIVNLFDTYHAAVELDLPRKSLAFLLSTYCDFTADKRYQLADWRIRPLPDEMLSYARSDTHFLLYVYDCLRKELLEKSTGGRAAINEVLARSMQTSLNVFELPAQTSESASILAKKWNKAYFGTQRAAFEAIYSWRDRTARNDDESYKYVLPDQYLFALAEHPPKDASELLNRVRPTSHVLRSRATELVENITNAIIEEERRAKEKAVKREANAKLGAMVVDAGPLLLTSNTTLQETHAIEKSLWSLDAPQPDPLVASSSAFLTAALPHSVYKASRFSELANQIHNSIAINQARSRISSPPALASDATLPTPNIATGTMEQTPINPEQIAFVPAAQRTTLSSANAKGETSKAIKLEESSEDDVVEVKAIRRQKIRTVTRVPVIDRSLLAATSSTSVLETLDETDTSPSLFHEAPMSPGKKAKRKRSKEKKNGKTPTLGLPEAGPDNMVGPTPFDYSSNSNLLDDGSDVLGGGVRAKKRKTDKFRGRDQPQGVISPFPAAPKSHVQPKSGNKSFTFKP